MQAESRKLKMLERRSYGKPRAASRAVAYAAVVLTIANVTIAEDGFPPGPTTAGAVQSESSSGETKPRRLPTRPVGLNLFRTLAEVDATDAVQPGDVIDVKLTTLGDEGPKATIVLRNIRVYSVEPPLEQSTLTTSEDASVDPNRVMPRIIVGLLANGPELETLRVAQTQGLIRLAPAHLSADGGVLSNVIHSFITNLFQPLLLFFFLGFAVPLLNVPLEFPKPLYQSLTIYLLLAIGWHGGELMAQQSSSELAIAGGMLIVGVIVNGLVGLLAGKLLQWFTPMRRIDTVTVGAYYGSDSAGTFVTCIGILATLGILYDSYMPVLLAGMEIPGCLVGLFMVSRMRQQGMDSAGNMPGESGYDDSRVPTSDAPHSATKHSSLFSAKVAHEVFLNPGLFLLFGGLGIGFISGLQAIEDPHVVEGPDHLFVFIFKGALCLFLLEMGITACERLRDLKAAGWGFVAFGVLGPVLFATVGMIALHVYSICISHAFYLGTYALFAVLCGAASYIAVPAVQRLAIPEASPTLPLAASLGMTFTFNVTVGIPVYIEIARLITTSAPVG